MTGEKKPNSPAGSAAHTVRSGDTVAPERGSVDSVEGVAVFVSDLEGRISVVNRAFEDRFVASGEEVVGSSIQRYLGPEETNSELLAQLRAGESVSRQLRLDTVDDARRRFSFEAVPVGPAGDRVVGIYIDRTEQERAEAKSELLTEVSRGIGEADSLLSGLETTVESICTYTEWTYGEVWTPADGGDRLEFSLGHTDESRVERFLTASEEVTFQFGEGLPGRAYDSQSAEWMPDASEEPVDVFRRAEWAAAAELRAAFAVPVVVDQTVVSVLTFFLHDRRERDARLANDVRDVVSTLGGLVKRKQVEDQLRQQNEQLDRFTSSVSHDLRNPLSVARGYVELVETNSSEAELTSVSNALDRMDELVENLLTLSQQGSAIGEQRQISLDETATAAWECVETGAATVDITGGQLQGDPTRVQQLFENLFRNSVEHGSPNSQSQGDNSPPVGADVTVRVGPLEPIGTTTRMEALFAVGFYVEDDGPGIPAEEREAVFDEAYSTGGTGLGLVTVKEIATAHGWEVRCTESHTGGARFEFSKTDEGGSTDLNRPEQSAEPDS